MPKAPHRQARARLARWEKRVRSPTFRRELTDALASQIEALADVRVGNVLGPERIRRILRQGGVHLLDRGALADLLFHASGVVERRLATKNSSILGLLDTKLVSSIEALLKENPVLSEPMEEFVGSLMRQEFMQGLFTDIIYTSLVSFYQRLNPLFGRIAMSALEEQIKSFIRLFMPMIQKEAIAFAVNRQNQTVLLEFTRAIVRRLLDQPLRHYFDMLSARQRKKLEGLVRNSVEDPKLASLGNEIALTVWDAVYDHVKDLKIGDLLRLEARASWLAEQIVELVLPLLSLPAVFPLLAAALEQAAVESAPILPARKPAGASRPTRNRNRRTG